MSITERLKNAILSGHGHTRESAKEMSDILDQSASVQNARDITANQASQRSQPPRKERLTWSATDITNQYKDLRFWAANDSLTLMKSTDGITRDESVDYTISDPRNTTITCVADVAASLQNKFLRISSPTVTYGVWFNVDGAGVVPTALMNANQIRGGVNPIDQGPALTAVTVAIVSNSSANTVATALFNAIVGIGGLLTIFQGPTPAANIVVVTPIVASTGEQYLIDPPDAGNTGFTMTTESTNVLPSRITLKPGGALATGGTAALVANNITVAQYRTAPDPVIPEVLFAPNIALHSAAEIAANPALVPTMTAPYYKMGKGAPIIMLHSEATDNKGVLSQIRDLSERYTVYAPNLPYSGNPLQYPYPDTGLFNEEVIMRYNLSFIDWLTAQVGPCHFVLYSRHMATGIKLLRTRNAMVKSITLNGPFIAPFNGQASTDHFMRVYDSVTAAIVCNDIQLINDEAKAIVNGTHTNPTYNAATADQRLLTGNKLLGDWGIPTASIDANRTYNDGVTTRTYQYSFRTISTSTPSAAATQATLDGCRKQGLILNGASTGDQSIANPTVLDVKVLNDPRVLILRAASSGAPSFDLSTAALASFCPLAKDAVIAAGNISPMQFATVASLTAMFDFLKDK